MLAKMLTKGSDTLHIISHGHPVEGTWHEGPPDRRCYCRILQRKILSLQRQTLFGEVLTASKLDMNEVARLFGQGATYDAVEGQLRKAKKAATALKDEAAGRSGPAMTPSRSKKTKNVNDSPVKTRELLQYLDCPSGY